MITKKSVNEGVGFYYCVNQILDEYEAQTHGVTVGQDAAVLKNLLALIFNLAHEVPGREENTEYARACLVAHNIIKWRERALTKPSQRTEGKT